MPVFPVSGRVRGSMLHELRGGWSAFVSRPWAWITVACFTLYIGFGWAPLQVLAPQVARVWLGGPGAWAAIAVALGVGSVGGGLVALRVRPRHPLRLPLAVFVIVTPALTALTALLAAHAALPAIVAVALVDGAAAITMVLFAAALAAPAVRNFSPPAVEPAG